jgi:sec-independent protein translocase protein TatB
MFDIGFSEMLVIAVVALIVIGPERLPKVARTLGHLFGRMQRYVNDVKADISREMELDELRKLQTQIQDAAQSFETSVKSGMSATESELQQIAQEVNPVALASGALSPAAAQAAPAIPPSDPAPGPLAPAEMHATGPLAPAEMHATGPLAPAEMHATGPLAPAETHATGQLSLAGMHAPDQPSRAEVTPPGQLTPAESRAQLSLDLAAAPVPADKPV